jgi:hypothetical protein
MDDEQTRERQGPATGGSADPKKVCTGLANKPEGVSLWQQTRGVSLWQQLRANAQHPQWPLTVLRSLGFVVWNGVPLLS